MRSDLAALLIPPQEERLRDRFDLRDAPLTLITSGWQKLVVAAPDRVFAFPRGVSQVPMVECEADVLSAVRPPAAPQLFGLHRDPAISPYPFLELGRIPGTPWRRVERQVEFEDAARCLEHLARHIAAIHQLTVPERLTRRPAYLDNPRIPANLIDAARELVAYVGGIDPMRWTAFLDPVAGMRHTAVHGELSRGQFLVDARLQVSGIVDWDGLHLGHPLLDLDFGVDLYRIYEPACDRTLLRQRIWAAYVASRAASLPEWPRIRAFWSLLDALTLVRENVRSRIPGAIAELRDAMRELP